MWYFKIMMLILKLINVLQSLAFHDVNPQAPVHVIVIPKKVISGVSATQDEDKEVKTC